MIVGYVFCIITNHHNETSFVIIKLFMLMICVLMKKTRHEGIGTALYEYVLNMQKSIGCYNVTLNVWEGNGSAMEFYKGRGMKLQKICMEKFYKT